MFLFNNNKKNNLRNRARLEDNYISYKHSVYHQNRDKEHNKFEVRDSKNSKYLKNNIFGIILTLITLLVLFSILRINFVPKLYIIGNNQTVNNYLDNEYRSSIVKSSSEFLSKSIFNQTKVTFSPNNLDKFLSGKYGFIQSINTQTAFFSNTLSIYITVSAPAIRYSIQNSTYLINLNGQIENINYYNPILKKLNLIPVIDQGNISIKQNEYIFSSQEVNEILIINNTLKADGYTVNKFVLNKNGSEIDAYLSKYNYYVKFNLMEGDINLQIGRFIAIEKYLINNNIVPKEYIDVRVDGRVYYL